MLTCFLDHTERLDIYRTVEVFDNFGQIFVHFFDRLWLIDPSLCNCRYLLNPGHDRLPCLT